MTEIEWKNYLGPCTVRVGDRVKNGDKIVVVVGDYCAQYVDHDEYSNVLKDRVMTLTAARKWKTVPPARGEGKPYYENNTEWWPYPEVHDVKVGNRVRFRKIVNDVGGKDPPEELEGVVTEVFDRGMVCYVDFDKPWNGAFGEHRNGKPNCCSIVDIANLEYRK